MKKIVVAISLLISTLSAQIYKVGDSVYDFSGSLCPEGNQTISLYDYNGTENGGNYHVVWLIFFNLTSRSCQLEAAYTQSIMAQFADAGLATIGVGNGWRETVECTDWKKLFGVTYPIIDDSQSDIRDIFTRGTVPHHVLINHEMEVIYTARGYIMPPFGNDFLAVLNSALSELTTLSLDEIIVPDRPGIQKCYPNPFNPAVTVNFALQDEEFTQISVYNILGEKVDDLTAATFMPGFHDLRWNATEFPTGVYFIQLVTPTYQQTRKIMYLK